MNEIATPTELPLEARPKWMASQVLRQKPESVDHQHSCIRGALICSEGPAKGHGVHLDSEFIDTVYAMGKASGKKGIKARFGHPNMCSSAIGTFLGRWKNFTKDTIRREDGSQAAAVRADCFISNSAAKSPKGNLKEYVLELADNESDMFGTSIVFTPGRYYKRDKAGEKVIHPWDEVENETVEENKARREKWSETSGPVFIECEELHADDVVDDPAANDSLFAADTVAGEVSEFLDLNPEVVEAFQSNPAILDVLSTHHAQIQQFITNYLEYATTHGAGAAPNQKEDSMSEETTVSTPEQPETPAAGSEALETATPPEATATPESETPLETPAEPEQPAETPADESLSTETPTSDSGTPASDPDPARAEFARMREDFGAEIAAETFAEGGSYADAQKKAYDASQARVKELESQVAASGGSGSDGASATPAASDKSKSFEDFFVSKKDK